MFIFFRFQSISILLCLLHTTSSFVLLTANIDDVKKLAGKFVSESLAEKIADFIAKATEHIITKASREDLIDHVSEENAKYNIARERIEVISQKNNDDQSMASYEGIELADANEKRVKVMENNERIKTDNYRQEYNSKYANSKQQNSRFIANRERDMQPSYLKASEDDSVKTKYKKAIAPVGQYYPLKSNRQVNSKYVQQRPKSIQKSVNTSGRDISSTIGYAEIINGNEEYKGTKKLKSKINQSRVQKSSSKKQLEVNIINYRNNNATDGGFPKDVKALSTKRIRSEFDQYDNINYSKLDFVATSGPVALPKVTNKKWVDEDGEEAFTKKFWF